MMKSHLRDGVGEHLKQQIYDRLEIRVERLRVIKLFLIELDIELSQAQRILTALVDPVLEWGRIVSSDHIFSEKSQLESASWYLSVWPRFGITDQVGQSVHRLAMELVQCSSSGQVKTGLKYAFWGLNRDQIEMISQEMFANPWTQEFYLETPEQAFDLKFPDFNQETASIWEEVKLRFATPAQLVTISEKRMLSLSLAEMQAIQAHFCSLAREPSDVELECLAQTWSEHCKHKIFNAEIDYTGPDGQHLYIQEGLFQTYIVGATNAALRKRQQIGWDRHPQDFVRSAFHDNAGVVRFTHQDHLVYKIETHNSPSALDPRAGALTGILGVNRDIFGTGRGAEALTNVWGFCIGKQNSLHSQGIRQGLHRGVSEGGNQSGVPYSRGFELFDDAYRGKPLVFCGAVGLLPVSVEGTPGEQKNIQVGDAIVMVGGRIGKDGIHGATFASDVLTSNVPGHVVQMGDAFVQKVLSDFLLAARDQGLFSGLTDNGAGGLSSSVGELAKLVGGACIDLKKAPLKYEGLQAWEILISEAQERMTVAVPQANLSAFTELAKARGVEVTVLGNFTDSGYFAIYYGDEQIAHLSLSFLHDGMPKMRLHAQWSPNITNYGDKQMKAPSQAEWSEYDAEKAILKVLSAENIRSNEAWARCYDHEVKGLSVIKPWIGVHQDVPSGATVMRARHERNEGIVLAESVNPFYGQVDTYEMATACVDEAVRRVLCAGARIDRLCALDNFCWPDPLASDRNPDGLHKLAQLVRCCQGLRDACEAYHLPLISGKDSMKNDAWVGDQKISVHPTLLVSVLGQVTDVHEAKSFASLMPDDDIFLLGATKNELGQSEFSRVYDFTSPSIPQTNLAFFWQYYQIFAQICEQIDIRGALALGRGGLAIALAYLVLANELGLEITWPHSLQTLSWTAILFAESTGRILFASPSQYREKIFASFHGYPLAWLGKVKEPIQEFREGWLAFEHSTHSRIYLRSSQLRNAFKQSGSIHE